MKEVKPDQSSSSSKKEQVEAMFDSIAHKYDFLNRFLSLGIDKGWRTKAMKALKPYQPKTILDVATGTGDLALEAMKILKPEKIVGLDLSEQMLQFGRVKIEEAGLSAQIQMVKGDSENLPFDNNQFDAITVAFGVRNFQNLEAGLKEMHRVLRTGGRVAILEFSKPSGFPFKQVFQFYFKNILPVWGNMLSKSSNAYTYLPESVQHFPEGKEFASILVACGYKDISVQPLTFGTCT
ncbi:MAG: bifunctional demethylmenaquinone methyltransferase/2-methoxy-6-polyprenyl-1,4-benzoquinol methylase UbiE, partial [Bacteroidia bacterium]